MLTAVIHASRREEFAGSRLELPLLLLLLLLLRILLTHDSRSTAGAAQLWHHFPYRLLHNVLFSVLDCYVIPRLKKKKIKMKFDSLLRFVAFFFFFYYF